MTERRNTEDVEIFDDRNHNFFIIDNEVLNNYNLTDAEFRVYCTLVMNSHNRTKKVCLTTKELCKLVNKTDKPLRKAVQGLEEKGLIEILEETKPGRWVKYNYVVKPVEKEQHITKRNISEGVDVPTEKLRLDPPEKLRQYRRKNSDSTGGDSPLKYKDNKYKDKKDLKKVKPLFQMPEQKTDEELFLEKIEGHIENGTLPNFTDFNAYYSLVHKDVFGCKPGGSPKTNLAKDVLEILVKLGLREEILLVALPTFLKTFKVRDGFGRLSYNMIIDQYQTNHHLKVSAEWAAYEFDRNKRREEQVIVDEEF